MVTSFVPSQRATSFGRTGRVGALSSTKRTSESHERVRGYSKSSWLPRETHGTKTSSDKTRSSEDDNHEDLGGSVQKLELGAEVVEVVTKAAVGVAVGGAAASVSEERGLPPPRRPRRPGGEAPGAKRKALASLLYGLLTYLRADDDGVLFGLTQKDIQRALAPGRSSASTGARGSSSSTPWLGPGAAVVDEWIAQDERRGVWDDDWRRGVDFSCGAVLISTPTSSFSGDKYGAAPAGNETVGFGRDGGGAGRGAKAWSVCRRLVLRAMESSGAIERVRRTVRDYIPRMPREVLLMVVSVAGGELAKREIAAQVEALEEPVREPAWALLNETYRNIEAWGAELAESNWNVTALITKQLADWKRRGVGNSYQEALLKQFLQLQTQAVLRPLLLSSDSEGSLMVQLNATYRVIEESVGKLLPQQTKDQLAHLEGLARKLEDRGVGELSFDEAYRALLLGAVPPTLVSDAVRLLAGGRDGEGGGRFTPGMSSPSVYDSTDGTAGDVTLATLASRLNDSRAVSQVMTYTALAAETEVIENLREVLDGLQSNIRTALLDLESDLVQQSSPTQAQPKHVQDAASYMNLAARSAITLAIELFNSTSKVFDASFEALAEPSRRTLLRSSRFLPLRAWYNAWSNATSSAYVDTDGRGNGSTSMSAHDGRGSVASVTRGEVEGKDGKEGWSPRVDPLDGGQPHVVLYRDGKQAASPVDLDQEKDETEAPSRESIARAVSPSSEREVEDSTTGTTLGKSWEESVSLWERLFRRRRQWRRQRQR